MPRTRRWLLLPLLMCAAFPAAAHAQSRAISYPASAWRITPVAGSLNSTRRIFSSASAVPSHTITTPECWE